MPEWPGDGIQKACEVDLFGIHGDCTGLDFGKIENVADQVQQIRARAMDGSRKLNEAIEAAGGNVC